MKKSRRQSRVKSDVTVSQPKEIPIQDIALIDKHGRIFKKMTKPLMKMTDEERQWMSQGWINDGNYGRGEG